MTDKAEMVNCPRFGWYEKVDLNKGGPEFNGSPKSLIASYLHWIKVCKANLGKVTDNGSTISVLMINVMTRRVNELSKRYKHTLGQHRLDEINNAAAERWDELHNNKN